MRLKCRYLVTGTAMFILITFFIEDPINVTTMSQNKKDYYFKMHANKHTVREQFGLGNDFKRIRNITSSNNIHKMALIVPFRNCTAELMEFAPHMMKFLNNQNIPYTIYVVNQEDDLRFNRASLVNIGFLESHTDCDYIAIHDVDLLPLNPKLSYSFPSKGPFHVSSPDLHPLYHYSLFVGGILLMTRTHYEKVNGMSNKFWGWGGEDDELTLRILHHGFKISRPHGLKTGVRNTFRHIHESKKRPRDQIRPFNQNKIRRRLDLSSGLTNTQYTVESRNTTLINGTYVTFINVHLTCDVKITPWCLQEKDHHLLKT